MFNALLYKKHPELYRQRIQLFPPVHYYICNAALLAAAVGIFNGRSLMAAGGAIIWALATALFCAWRLRGTSRAPRHVAEMAATSALIPLLAIWWRIFGAFRFRVFFL
jgi:hypothetical protein